MRDSRRESAAREATSRQGFAKIANDKQVERGCIKNENTDYRRRNDFRQKHQTQRGEGPVIAAEEWTAASRSCKFEVPGDCWTRSFLR